MGYKDKDKNFVRTVKEYIDTNYADKNISIGFISELVGYSIMRINDMYKKRYGMTPMEYLSATRIEKVKGLIEEGVPLGKAADIVGYGSIRTFYRVFKDNTGMSPERYKIRIFNNYERFKDVVSMKDLRPLDYARKQSDAIMFMYEPRKLKPFDAFAGMGVYSYHQGLFLLGMYRLYCLSFEKKYFNYIKAWVDSVVDSNGKIRIHEHMHNIYEWISPDCLDFRQPCRILFPLYEATADERYMKLIEYSIETLLKYPKTKDGGFWHRLSQPHQMRLEGLYMASPAMCMYAKMNNRPEFYDMAVKQLEVMFEKTYDEKTGLLRHAWDESKQEEWADPDTGQSPYVCGRAIGFFVAAAADIAELLPDNHQKKQTVIDIGMRVLDALINYQGETGHWYYVVDRKGEKGNKLENSCTCLISYALAKFVNMGFGDSVFERAAIRGYSGVIDTISYGEAGEMLLDDTSVGSAVSSDIKQYFEYEPRVNDLHGSGAFVLMCIEVEKLLDKNL